jgi:hypothetical protein
MKKCVVCKIELKEVWAMVPELQMGNIENRFQITHYNCPLCGIKYDKNIVEK